jgi:hypothetical protein
MRPLFKDHLTKRLRDLRTGLRHAFSTHSDSRPLSMDDIALMERIADVLVRRGMSAPATMFLDSMGPMNFLGSQALHFLTPIIDCAFNAKEVEQVARLLERRETISQLIAVIEVRSSGQKASAQ